MIEIKALSKNFGSHIVLTDVNLNIPDGSVFGLIGPNGAGKSTLLRILSGIVKPDVGGVLYDGNNVYENPEVKQNILMISDDPHYFFHASIADMKEFYKVWYPQFNERIYHQFLSIFKLDEKKPMADFSKGMKRQAFIAIALAIAPKYLFLDEAFDGLDPIMRLTFKRAIMEMIEEKEMTVIISSHNLREMEDICDSFGILENGNISTSGDLDTTKDNGNWEVVSKDSYNNEYSTGTITESYFTDSKTTDTNGNTIYTWEIGGTSYETFFEEWATQVTETRTIRDVKVDNKTILHNADLEKELKPGEESKDDNGNPVKLYASKVLSNTDEIDLNNDAEITEVKRDQKTGREIIPASSSFYDRGETIIVTPPTGQDQNLIAIIATTISAFVILGAGVVLIRKKILGNK